MTAARFSPVAITGVSAITAVGDGAAQTCASVRAGLMGFTEHAFHAPIPVDPRPPGEDPEDVGALLCAPVEAVDPRLDGPSRLVALAALALPRLAEDAERELAELGDAALLVSLPAPDAVVATWHLARDFAPRLRAATGLAFEQVRVSEVGSAGMLALLAEASALLASGAVKRCVLLGADSYLAEDRLKMLDASYRIKTRRNVDGLIPGEAATAILLEAQERAAEEGTAADGIVTGIGSGSEPETFFSEKQSTGAGLTGALRALLASAGGAARAGWVLCDLNGESYRAMEWGLTLVRLGDELSGIEKLLHPANCFGDIGAATGGALMTIAATSFRRGYAPSDEATLFCGTDGALRAAARIRRA